MDLSRVTNDEPSCSASEVEGERGFFCSSEKEGELGFSVGVSEEFGGTSGAS